MKETAVRVQYKTRVIVWAALLISQLLFLLLISSVKPDLFRFDISHPFFDDQPLVILVFSLGAAALFILSFIFRNQHIARAAADQDASCVQTALVLGCALCEVISMLGVLLAFVFEYPYYFLWIALGALGILLHFPRKGNLDAASYKKI